MFLSEPAFGPTVSHPRNLIVAEAGSQAAVVETYLGTAGEAYFTNSVTEIVLGDGAVLDFSRLEREGDAAFHVGTTAVSLGRNSNFTSHSIQLGGALARHDLNVRLDAEGADCTLNGLFLGNGTQLLDNHTLIDHAKPHGTSRELYKGILDGKSRGIFHGTIIVRPDAQKTDAMQTNRNLLLSKESLVNSEPALEIFADDVKCRHGSTIGQLDAAAMFYLRSRGIGEDEARNLLVYAFASDVASRIRVAPLRALVEAAPRSPAAGRRPMSSSARVRADGADGSVHRLDVEAIRRDFPILSREVHGRPLVYLDNAATTQKPEAVISAGADMYRRSYGNIHRGVHQLSVEATDAVRGGPREGARVHQRRGGARDRLRPRDDRGHQPRSPRRTVASGSARGTRSSSPPSSTTRTSFPGSSSATRRRRT